MHTCGTTTPWASGACTIIGDVATSATPIASRRMSPANSCSTASGAWAQTGRGTAGAGAARNAASWWPA
eukprot:846167-Prymnesium_polylepis.1